MFSMSSKVSKLRKNSKNAPSSNEVNASEKYDSKSYVTYTAKLVTTDCLTNKQVTVEKVIRVPKYYSAEEALRSIETFEPQVTELFKGAHKATTEFMYSQSKKYDE